MRDEHGEEDICQPSTRLSWSKDDKTKNSRRVDTAFGLVLCSYTVLLYLMKWPGSVAPQRKAHHHFYVVTAQGAVVHRRSHT